MKKALFLLASLTTLSAITGCASIISGSHPVSIQSTPSMLSFRILDEKMVRLFILVQRQLL